MHVRIRQRTAALAAIAGGARGDKVGPGIAAARSTRYDVIDGEVRALLPTVLAAIVVAPEDFAFGEFDARMRPPDEVAQADDAGAREQGVDRADMAASVLDDLGFADHDQADGPPRVADVQRLVVSIEDQNRFVHGSLTEDVRTPAAPLRMHHRLHATTKSECVTQQRRTRR